MAIASKFPVGYLDLLGMQNFGENPREVANFVQSIVDIGEQYLLGVTVLLQGSAGGGANGFNLVVPDMVVPNGEVWRLFVFSCSVATAAGVTGSFAPALRPVTNAGGRISLANSRDVAASRTETVVATAVPIWIGAGSQLGVEMQNVAGGAPGYSAQAMVARLRA